MKRAKMLPVPLAIYDRVDSRYPDRIRVLMDDGKSIIFTRERMRRVSRRELKEQKMVEEGKKKDRMCW